jgi:hypothetical protein
MICNFGARPPPLISKSSKDPSQRLSTDAPWYVTNALLRRDLHIPSVKEEIQGLSSQYSARLNSHPNLLTANLKKQSTNRRLQRSANRSAHQISCINLDVNLIYIISF